MIKSVIRCPNNMVVVFNAQGEQLPEYQGQYKEVRERILKDAPPDAIFGYLLNHDAELKAASREVLNKAELDEQDLKVLTTLASMAALAIDSARLRQAVLDGHKSTIKSLAAAIDAKDPYTCGHSQRVMEYALLGGISLSLSKEKLEAIEYAGILHDIGKIGVPDSTLCKPSYLSDEEWVIMRRHPEIGANIINDIPFLEEARELVLHHHERYDGNGYPDGLKGKGTPIGARLLAVADAFDTMTTDRSYRTALSVDYAINELYRCSGTQFCPVAVEAFISGLATGPSSQPVVNQTQFEPELVEVFVDIVKQSSPMKAEIAHAN